MKDYNKALQSFSQALLSKNPHLQSESHYNLGNTLYQRGEAEKSDANKLKNWEGALPHYEETLKAEPQNKNAKDNYEFVKKKIEELKKKQEQKPSPSPTPTPSPSPSPSPQKDKNKDQQKNDKDQEKNDQQQKDQQSQGDQGSGQGEKSEGNRNHLPQPQPRARRPRPRRGKPPARARHRARSRARAKRLLPRLARPLPRTNRKGPPPPRVRKELLRPLPVPAIRKEMITASSRVRRRPAHRRNR